MRCYPRTLARDSKILSMLWGLDGEEVRSPKEICYLLKLSSISIVYDAVRRRRYIHVEQLSKTFQNKILRISLPSN